MPEHEPNAPPSSLEDAVMREISDRSPAPGTSRSTTSDPPPIIEPSELKRRSSNPPGDDDSDESVLPSIPPDAIVPGAVSSDEMPAVPAVSDALVPTAPVAMPAVMPVAPAQDDPEAEIQTGEIETAEIRYESPFATKVVEGQEASAPAEAVAHKPEVAAPAKPEPDVRKRSSWGYLVGFAVLAMLVVAALKVSGGSEGEYTSPPTPTPTATPTATATATATPTATATATPTPTATATATPTPTASAAADDVPPGAEVPAGYGLITIDAPAGARVRVDGATVGLGPTSSVAAPGYHEVRVEQGGRDVKSVVEVRAGKTTHAGSTLIP